MQRTDAPSAVWDTPAQDPEARDSRPAALRCLRRRLLGAASENSSQEPTVGLGGQCCCLNLLPFLSTAGASVISLRAKREKLVLRSKEQNPSPYQSSSKKET